MNETKNIILVTSDSVRYDSVFSESNGEPTTPNLEKLSSTGVTFTNATSPGARTSSSVPEIISGEYMPYTEMLNREHRFRLIKDTISSNDSLPERLAERGYSTAAITASPYTTSETGFDEIFDVLHDVGNYEQSSAIKHIPGEMVRNVMKRVDEFVENKHWFNQWPNFYDEILGIIDDLPEPYFLWVFLLDTHNPYLPPRTDRIESSTFSAYYALWKSNQTHSAPSTQTSLQNEPSSGLQDKLNAAYRDTIRSVDRFVYEIWEDTREDDSVLIFHSDHGEAFGEHGTYGHHPVVYEENIRVPFVICNTETISEINEPISLRQVPEMVVEYVENETAFGNKRWTGDYTVSRAKNGTVAIRGSKWKYISGNNGERIYNLETDPNEQQNLIEEHPDVLSTMQEQKDTLMDKIKEKIQTKPGTEVASETVERLESLGYVEK